ncbi:hypothetical protein DEI93_10865 [Curtobacterium sp. MCBD17_035]|uniref:hypothetical protein n=1 Tax=Curtobacterium sp. MCBD17_035 TaxID=2175673 RepID=UPI000DAA10AA|nr:hypothetical protein [Curtobacterium sp. MCBD17_035]WIB66478.1 hypothetical protein DEI93_10865 [Curtobacterium sp. MCBD17_035]
MNREPARTPQQYDPLGALGSRPLALVTGAASVVWALVASIVARDVPGSPTLSALTVLLVAAAAGVSAFATSPFRAPFARGAFVAYTALLAAASIASVAAQWGPDRDAANDFMPLVTGVGILVMAPYRPWRDVLVGGAVLAVVDAVAFGAVAAAFPSSVPVAVSAVLAAVPTVVLTTAAVAFAWTFVGLAERVQIRAASYSVERAERDGIARSVQQDRVTILARDVIPFFEQLRRHEAITDADRARARSIADGIRRVMVAEADRTWLEQALMADGAEAAHVDDPGALIRSMDVDQRTVVRTAVRAVLRASTVDPAGVRIRIEPDPHHDGRVRFTLEAAVAATDLAIHRAFDPYLAVLRVTFPDLDVEVRPSALALRFSYDQH